MLFLAGVDDGDSVVEYNKCCNVLGEGYIVGVSFFFFCLLLVGGFYIHMRAGGRKNLRSEPWVVVVLDECAQER